MATESAAAHPASVPLGVPVIAWKAMAILCGAAPSLLYDAIFEPVFLGALMAVGAVAVFCFRAWQGDSRSWLRVAFDAVILGLVLNLCTLFAWWIAETAARGRAEETLLWPARIALALFFVAILLFLLKRRKRLAAEIARRTTLGLLLLVVSGAFGYTFWIAGPADTSIYPPRHESPYRLPWKPGNSHLCCQGNLSAMSHDGWQSYAYDFIMPVGTEVCAARAGQIVAVVDENDGNGFDAKSNHVYILHHDGSYAAYLHIRLGGSRVKVGQWVEQGETIAMSGNVGYSSQPHLHFHVVRDRTTIPVTFADVPGDGIPRSLRRYMSGQG